MADLDWGRIVNIGGALLLIVLGAWVAARRPLRRENVAFGVFSACLGLFPALFNLSNLLNDGRFLLPFAYPSEFARLCCGVALVLVALWFPVRVRSEERRGLVLAALVGASIYGLILGSGLLKVIWFPQAIIYDAPTGWDPTLLMVASAAYHGGAFFALTFLPLRYGDAAPAHRTLLALMGVAIALYPALVFTSQAEGDRSLDTFPFNSYLVALMTAVVAMLWMRAFLRSGDRRARNVALATLSMTLVGMAVGSFDGGYELVMVRSGVPGLVRLATASVLAYAILKHQLLGIDVKVRFAISKSTVAAIFIAVFFIASEAAQQFFGDRTGSTYFGIAIAGTLVFAFAPIQRAAEKLAAKAVPITPSAAAPVGTDRTNRDDTFRRAVLYTLRDRNLSRDEELHLARLATELGIPADRAVEIRYDLQQSLPRKGASRKGAR